MTQQGIERLDFVTCDAVGPRSQYGALCWRMRRDRVEVLLITSRDTGRWVIPKGWPMAGLAPEAAAAREAWEEAGVEGAVDGASAGCYTYQKVLGPTNAVPCEVAVFGLRVARLVAQFPERKQRRRKWFSVAKAARKVWEPELRSLMLGFVPPKGRVKLAGKGAQAAALTQATDHDARAAALLADWQAQDSEATEAALHQDGV